MATPYSQQSFQVLNTGPTPVNFSFNGNEPTFTAFGAIVSDNWRPGSLRSPLDIYVTQVSEGPGIGTNTLTTLLQSGTKVETFQMTVPADLSVRDRLQLYFGLVSATGIWWLLARDGKPVQGHFPKPWT